MKLDRYNKWAMIQAKKFEGGHRRSMIKTFNHKGYECAVVLHDFGHFCGYIAIPKTNPILEVDTETEVEMSLSFHGGITYRGEAFWLNDKSLVAWGFDCAHGGDFLPTHAFMSIDRKEAYDMQDYIKHYNKDRIWTVAQVQRELTDFIDELFKLKDLLVRID